MGQGALVGDRTRERFAAQVARWLEEFRDDSKLRPEARLNMEGLLQRFLLALAKDEEHAPARRAQSLLVAAMLERLKGELRRLSPSRAPRFHRLACLLAANYAAIASRGQRRQFVALLRRLSRRKARGPNLAYDDPFLVDLLIILDHLNLPNLERHWQSAPDRPRRASK
jgi:hypothetical protein